MKLRAVGSIINQGKQLVLYDEGKRQWIGTGSAVYLLPEGLSQMTEKQACTVLDIPEDKAASWLIIRKDMPESYDTADEGDEELTIFDPGKVISTGGVTLMPLTSETGKTYFLQTKFLKPLTDKDPVIALRYTPRGQPYMVAKAGMFAEAILMPWAAKPELTNWLSEIVTGASKARMYEDRNLTDEEE